MPTRKRYPTWHSAVLTAILALGVFFFQVRPWPTVPADEVVQMKGQALKEFQVPGEVLALDMDLALMAGKKIWLQPMEYTRMVESGAWSDKYLLRDIREKKYSIIEIYDLPEQYLLTRAVQEGILKNYTIRSRKYGRLWLVPQR